MNQITISKELLQEAGYKCWKETPDEFTIRRWQKIIRDEKGTKYFLNIEEYSLMDAINGFQPSIKFEIPVKDSFFPVSIQLVQWLNDGGKYSQISIKEMEKVCEDIWIKLNGQYYESTT